jgi:hypothetical protein
VYSTSTVSRPTSFRSEFVPGFDANSTSTTFYVRAYAISGAGVSYGAIETVRNVNLNFMSVQMSNVTIYSGTSAAANVVVSGVSANNIAEWGIVYSDTNRTPSRTGSSSDNEYTLGSRNLTSETIEMRNLKPTTRYYARAYARTTSGNYIYSSPVREFTTPTSMDVTLYSPIEITHNSVTFSGNVSVEGAGNVTEMGFAYSRINNNPTVSDQRAVYAYPSSYGGNFNIDVSGLQANTQYFVRAYATPDTAAAMTMSCIPM